MLQRRSPPMRKLAGFCLVLGWLVFWSPFPAVAAPGPTEAVQQFYAELLDTMQHAASLGPKGRYQKLEPVLLASFDIPFMARLSIGPL